MSSTGDRFFYTQIHTRARSSANIHTYDINSSRESKLKSNTGNVNEQQKHDVSRYAEAVQK